MDQKQKYQDIVLKEVITEQLTEDESDLTALFYYETLTYLLDKLPKEEGERLIELFEGDNKHAFESMLESLLIQHKDGLSEHLRDVVHSLRNDE